MKYLKKIILFPVKIINVFIDGLFYVCRFAAKGFFYYISSFFKLLGKILPFKFVYKIEDYFKAKERQPEAFILLMIYCLTFTVFYNVLYKDDEPVVDNAKFIKEQIVKKDEEEAPIPDGSTEDNRMEPSNDDVSMFRRYSKFSLDEVNIASLKDINSDTVAWLSVGGTNINYPIVQTGDNDFYLNHTYDKSFRMTGWTFMDYRSSSDMSDDNTIFYGHNLLNDTSFGSIAKIFSNGWLNNSDKSIVVITENKKFVYRIFSAYYTNPNTDYLVTNFYYDSDKEEFLNKIKSASIVSLDNSDVNVDSRIITLSTCTDDNKGRKVVHAVLTYEG